MRIAFYAPLKAPDDPKPSGDRLIARMLMRALEEAGHQVALVSHFRSLDIGGDPDRQARIARLGGVLADRLLRAFEREPERRPDLWFTYHLYYKAPDWIGPHVARALTIPYVVAEASYAPWRGEGQWTLGHEAVAAALREADLVVGLNPRDEACARPLLKPSARYLMLEPFIDAAPFRAAREVRAETRARLAAAHGLDSDTPWLIAVAMMRERDKLPSYRLLAAALASIRHLPWSLLIVGDGPARAAVAAAMQPLEPRVAFLGRLDGEPLAQALAASDMFVWPAVNEAIGMAFLEAQAAGLPVVAGRRQGVEAVVADGRTGLLAEEGDAQAFAAACARLLGDARERARLAAAALEYVHDQHDIATQGRKLSVAFEDLIA